MSDLQPIWSPHKARRAAANLRQFQSDVEAGTGLTFTDYAALHQWSIEFPALFWAEVADFCGLQFDVECTDVLVGADCMPGARWFVGA
ncbi:MAG: acetyl-coenzyme A synthetase N-terminal domain-containing protein, partial [Gammaproteobacteria bacterium]|nr:acetyl-coenzyme A synthetase N-terminal domain-containing protein [Gammaproteobacteria bacterium]